MAIDVENRRFCVTKDNMTRVDKVEPKEIVKRAKKHVKIDCKKVFKEINQCMK